MFVREYLLFPLFNIQLLLKLLQTSEKSVLQLSSGFSWDTEFTLPSGDQQGEISNDDSDNEQDDVSYSTFIINVMFYLKKSSHF